MAGAVEGRADATVYALGHGSGVEAVVVVSQDGVEGHGVGQHVGLAVVAAVVVQGAALVRVLQGVRVHAGLRRREDGLAVVGELDGGDVQARVPGAAVDVREDVAQTEVAHVRRDGDRVRRHGAPVVPRHGLHAETVLEVDADAVLLPRRREHGVGGPQVRGVLVGRVGQRPGGGAEEIAGQEGRALALHVPPRRRGHVLEGEERGEALVRVEDVVREVGVDLGGVGRLLLALGGRRRRLLPLG